MQVSHQWTTREVLTWTTNRFKQADIETPLLDAQLLLCKVLNTKKINLYMDFEKPLTFAERACLREFVKRRLNGEPIAYILKEKHWYNLPFYVDEKVLIPRPETECLLDFIIETVKKYHTQVSSESPAQDQGADQAQPLLLYDFCTGSGCIAIALAKNFPTAKIIAIDISSDALHVAKQNAQINYVENIEWLNLDLTKKESYSLLKQLYGQAQALVANPPYVAESEWKHLDISVKNFEPKIALTAAEDGLCIGKKIIENMEEFSLLDNHFSVFGMEMAHLQPQKLINAPLKKCSFHHIIEQEKYINEWFSLSDLDNKSRFLCQIKINKT